MFQKVSVNLTNAIPTDVFGPRNHLLGGIGSEMVPIIFISGYRTAIY